MMDSILITGGRRERDRERERERERGEGRERERFMHSICEEEHEIRYLANSHTPKTKQSPYSDTQVLGTFFNPLKTWY